MSMEQQAAFALREHRAILAGISHDAEAQSWSLVNQPSTNAVYMAGGEVVRIARSSANKSLAYEAQIAGVIPPETGYPGIVDADDSNGFAWVKMLRVEGVPLADMWPGLAISQREKVLRGSLERLSFVHRLARAVTGSVAWMNRPPYPPPPISQDVFGDIGPLRFGQQLDHLERYGWVGSALRRALAGRHSELCNELAICDSASDKPFSVANFADAVPIHGDAAPYNFLLQKGETVAVLDFELAGYGPADVDVFRLIHWVDAANTMGDKNTAALLTELLSEHSTFSRKRMCMYYLVRWVGLADGWLHATHSGSTYQPQVMSEPVITKLEQELQGVGLFADAG